MRSATVSPLSPVARALAGELVEFTKNGVLGIALNLNADSVGIIIMGEYQDIREGDLVQHAHCFGACRRPGRAINAVGQPLDGKGPIETDSYRNVERIARRDHAPAGGYAGADRHHRH